MFSLRPRQPTSEVPSTAALSSHESSAAIALNETLSVDIRKIALPTNSGKVGIIDVTRETPSGRAEGYFVVLMKTPHVYACVADPKSQVPPDKKIVDVIGAKILEIDPKVEAVRFISAEL